MKVIISGGGTGGHIYPGIALADAIMKQDDRNEVLFIGATGKMEMSLVPAAGYKIIGLPIRGIARKQLYKNLSLPFTLLKSLWQARRILKSFKPDVVVGTGGYASFPTLYVASRMRIPVLLQEQNAYPGITNKVLAKYATKICVAYETLEAYFPAHKLVLTGNPVRSWFSLAPTDASKAYAHFGLTAGMPTVLVLGGSLGASTLVDCILAAHQLFAANQIQVLMAVGKAHFEQLRRTHADASFPHIKIVPYIEQMALAFSAASIIVSRAGAMAMAEMAMVQKPVILVPSPYVAADHQIKNVLPWLTQGSALVVKEEAITQDLVPTIIDLIKNEAQQNTLTTNLAKQAKPHAVDAILETIHQVIQKPQL